MSKADIRPISGADLEATIAIDTLITGFSRRGFYEKRFVATQKDPNAFIWLVAHVDGAVAGFVSAHILSGEFGFSAPVAVIDTLGTRKEARGKGVARALLEKLDVALKARQVSHVYTEASWAAHDLVQFFAAAGFKLAPTTVLECTVSADH